MGAIFTNVFGALIGLAILGWVVSIAVVTSPHERLQKTCAPVTWTGKLGVSFAMLTADSETSARHVQNWFDGATYGCEYTVWRLFWEEDWKKEQARVAREEEALRESAKAHPTPKPEPPKKP